MAAQCPIHKEMIENKRKEIRQGSQSRSCSQMRTDNQATPGLTYVAAVGGAEPIQRSEEVVLSRGQEMKELTTIILSSVVYSQYRELLEPSSF